MIIPLRDALLRRFSNLPAGSGFLLRGLSAWAHRADTLFAVWRVAVKSLPIWSCSVWGLPCRACYQSRGALLPHLFTLTSARFRSRRRYVLCCTGRPDGLNHPSRTLSGTLPCGVRTFLPRSTPLRTRAAAIIRPPAGLSVSCAGGGCCNKERSPGGAGGLRKEDEQSNSSPGIFTESIKAFSSGRRPCSCGRRPWFFL